jgi:hypothetical protein
MELSVNVKRLLARRQLLINLNQQLPDCRPRYYAHLEALVLTTHRYD